MSAAFPRAVRDRPGRASCAVLAPMRLLTLLLAVLCGACGEHAGPPSGRLSGSAGASAPGDSSGTPPAGARNLILITVDTLRADHIGANGGPVPTPNIDALAAAGVNFRRARSHIPATGPSHATLFTSRLPSGHGTLVNSQPLDAQNHTLAEILSERGWSTTAIVSLGVLNERFGFDQGFDSYSSWSGGRWWKSGDAINAQLRDWAEPDRDERDRDQSDRDQSDRDGPVFLFLHYSDPHTPYAPPDVDYPQVTLRCAGATLGVVSADARSERVAIELAPGDNDIALEPPAGTDRAALGCGLMIPSDRRVEVLFSSGADFVPGVNGGYAPPFRALPVALRLVNPLPEPLHVALDVTTRVNLSPEDWPEWYEREVAFVDGVIGRAVSRLKQDGLWEDSIVVFSSDHGEGLGQHGLQQHLEQLYDSLLRVPLIVVAPGLLPAGTVVDAPVRQMDVLPTVLELLGVQSNQPMRGSSLVSLARGEGDAAPRPALGETHRPGAKHELRSLVLNRFKYIVDRDSGQEELYALTDDPGELHDISLQDPETLARMRDAMAAQYALRIGPAVAPAGPAALSEEDRERMAELGYTH